MDAIECMHSIAATEYQRRFNHLSIATGAGPAIRAHNGADPAGVRSRRDGRTMATDTRPRPPSVEAVLAVVRRELDGSVDPDALTAAARFVVADERERLGAGVGPRTVDDLAAGVAARLAMLGAVRLETVINATGVIVHTNLGRAPWPRAAIEAAAEAAGAYLLPRARPPRPAAAARDSAQAEEHLVALTGAEDALVTNNNAAAVGARGRAGRARARRGRVARRARRDRRRGADPGDRPAGRGEADRGRDDEPDAGRGLRGGPRERQGAGPSCASTPRTSARTGFTETPDAAELAAIAHRHGAIVVDDLGLRRAAATRALRPAPRADALRAARGRRGHRHVQRRQARRRAAGRASSSAGPTSSRGSGATRSPGRCDPTRSTLAAVAATLGLYRGGRAESEIPVWRMIATPGRRARGAGPAGSRPTLAGARRSSRRWRPSAAARCRARRCRRTGSRSPGRAQRIVDRLRVGEPPVIGRIEQGRAVLDLRTVDPGRDADLTRAILRRSLAADDRRRRDRRPHRPRQDDAAPGADRDRRGPAARGAAARDDDRRRVRPPRARRRVRARLRRRARPRPADRQHARRGGRDRRGDARRRGRRRAAGPDARASRAARRARHRRRARGRDEGRRGRAPTRGREVVAAVRALARPDDAPRRAGRSSRRGVTGEGLDDAPGGARRASRRGRWRAPVPSRDAPAARGRSRRSASAAAAPS